MAESGDAKKEDENKKIVHTYPLVRVSTFSCFYSVSEIIYRFCL